MLENVPLHIQSYMRLEVPSSTMELKSFSRSCNVYQSNVLSFGEDGPPLNEKLQNDKPATSGKLTYEEIAAFEALQDRISFLLLLVLPRRRVKYTLDTDRCNVNSG